MPFSLNICSKFCFAHFNTVAQPIGRLALYSNLFYPLSTNPCPYLEYVFVHSIYLLYEFSLFTLFHCVFNAFAFKVITDTFAGVPLIIILHLLYHFSINKCLYIHIYESAVRTLYICLEHFL